MVPKAMSKIGVGRVDVNTLNINELMTSSAVAVRSRLIDGLERCVSSKGLAATTISDVVAAAQVSKRTFYEHFSDKDACFLASYLTCTERVLTAITEAVDTAAPWRQQVRSMMRAYLAQLQAKPALTQTFFLEIQAAGPKTLQARQGVYQRFNDVIRDQVRRMRKYNPHLGTLPPAMATAVVGGINALVLLAVESGRTDRLESLEVTATDLLCAVLERRKG